MSEPREVLFQDGDTSVSVGPLQADGTRTFEVTLGEGAELRWVLTGLEPLEITWMDWTPTTLTEVALWLENGGRRWRVSGYR